MFQHKVSRARIREIPRVLAVLSLILYAPARLHLSLLAHYSPASHNLTLSSDGERFFSLFNEQFVFFLSDWIDLLYCWWSLEYGSYRAEKHAGEGRWAGKFSPEGV